MVHRLRNNLGPLTFGFDIGIASVGWCVIVEINRKLYILDLGARCFDKAETAKEGESLNLARRTARLMRRRLRRRAWRLTKLARLLKREGLIADAKAIQQPPEKSPWHLRVEGLDKLLTPTEWAHVLYHLCKHRGFHWVSKAQEKKAESDKGEGGQVTQALKDAELRRKEKGYRSEAERILTDFPSAQRNKQGEYKKALKRVWLGEELELLFKRQRGFGNPHASPEFETRIVGNGDRKTGLFWEQQPALSGTKLMEMVGNCTFEKDGPTLYTPDQILTQFLASTIRRAPKASYSAERHVWLTRLNNLRIVVDGNARPLTEAERQIALPLPYQQAGDFKYEQLKKALVKAGLMPESAKFAGLNYSQKNKDGTDKDPESERLVKLPAWQEIRKTLKDAGLETEWQGIASQPELLDQIAWVLSVFKDGNEVDRELRKLPLPGSEKTVEALGGISFDKFSNLSLKALRKIIPHMEAGLRYDEACTEAGYHHSQLFKAGEGQQKYLPPLYSGRDKDGRMVFTEDEDIPRNPVVLRSLNQARKVLNALVHEYGSPSAVHIEMARDLSRPLKERKAISDEQDEYRVRNENAHKDFESTFNRKPEGSEFEKWMLYREQQGQCPYCQQPLASNGVVHKIFEIGETEIDHVLPYRRSFDNSKNNRVLVNTKCNRDKSDRTPYEFLGGSSNSQRWRSFATWVEGNNYRLAKKQRLLRQNFGEKESKEFIARNLNDTRYISRFFKNYVERHLQFSGETKYCVVLNGGLTSLLRAKWGLPTSKKKRKDMGDKNHAMDAAVIAACGRLVVKFMSTMLNATGWTHKPDEGGYENTETGEFLTTQKFARLDEVSKLLPRPWKNFREELLMRLNTDDPATLKAEAERDGYPPELLENVRPLFVSRAPQRRNSGAAHKETIYAQPESLKKQGGVTEKVKLSSLTLKDMDKLVDPHRNEKLYAAIRARLEAHGGKGDKAFPQDNPLHKPDRDGNPTGPIVRAVTMVIDKLSGIPIRGGIAKNDTMLRVDVFRHKKDKKYHLVPVYVHHAAKGLPNRAIVAFKDENEWTQIDDVSFDFCFSMYPNDLITVTQKSGETVSGYYRGCHSGTGAINIALHDRYAYGDKTTSLAFSKKSPDKPIPNDKLGLIEGVGVKMAAQLQKFNVDTLGHIYPAPPEKRRGLA